MIRFLLKGLIRDRSRSLFPILMVGAGAFLTVFLYGWMKGVMGDLVRVNAQFDTGHVKVVTRAYKELSDQRPNDLAILGVNKLLNTLGESYGDMIWVPRIRFGGLVDVPDDEGETQAQGPVMGLGVDLLSGGPAEEDILNLESALVKGSLPKHRDDILISDEFAEKTGIKAGSTVTLISSTMFGGMAMYNFVVSGTVRFGIAAMDKGALIADISAVQTALDMSDGASEILGFTRDMIYKDALMRQFTRRFNEKFSDDSDEFSPVMLSLGEHSGLSEYINLASSVGMIIVSIFVVVMSMVLWNAGLMNSLRRYGEIGVRLAMGEPKGRLYLSMIGEAVVIGFIGSIIGTIFGLGISYYLQYTGINFGNIFQRSSMLITSEIRAIVTGTSFYIGFLPGLIAPVIGTIFAGIGIYKRKTSELFKELEV